MKFVFFEFSKCGCYLKLTNTCDLDEVTENSKVSKSGHKVCQGREELGCVQAVEATHELSSFFRAVGKLAKANSHLASVAPLAFQKSGDCTVAVESAVQSYCLSFTEFCTERSSLDQSNHVALALTCRSLSLPDQGIVDKLANQLQDDAWTRQP